MDLIPELVASVTSVVGEIADETDSIGVDSASEEQRPSGRTWTGLDICFKVTAIGPHW